ncbi:pantocin A family RiPP [uncultured Shewanella sp.]
MIIFKKLTQRISAITEENAMYSQGQKIQLK